jgi:hypothetical protein
MSLASINTLAVRLFAIAILSLLFVRAITGIDMTWDTTAYHLPFIALRMGMMRADEFVLSPGAALFYDGFPSLLDYIRGVLWVATGRIEAVNILNLFSIVALLFYLSHRWNLPWAWSCIALLAVPAIRTGTPSAYTDVTANVALAITILIIVEAWSDKKKFSSKRFWAILMLSATIAGNSKLQIGAINLIALTTLVIPAVAYLRSEEWGRAVVISTVAIFIITFIMANATLLANMMKFGNPVYPVGVSIGPIVFEGPYRGGESYFPTYLEPWPQAIRWLLSILEYRALELRPITYMPGMGDVAEGMPSARMGGFLGSYVVFCLLTIPLATSRLRTRSAYVMVGSLVLLTIIVANFQASHESRYYMCWMILLVVVTLILTKAQPNLDLYIAVRFVALSSLIFTISVNGAYYLKPNWGSSDFISSFYLIFLKKNISDGDVICADQNTRFAFFASSVAQPEFAARVNYSVTMAACPEGGLVLPLPR